MITWDGGDPVWSILITTPTSYTDEGSGSREAFMRPASFLLTLSIAVPAHAEPLQIHGTTGYVSEYELSAAFPSGI